MPCCMGQVCNPVALFNRCPSSSARSDLFCQAFSTAFSTAPSSIISGLWGIAGIQRVQVSGGNGSVEDVETEVEPSCETHLGY